jgi:hypothetical protein
MRNKRTTRNKRTMRNKRTKRTKRRTKRITKSRTKSRAKSRAKRRNRRNNLKGGVWKMYQAWKSARLARDNEKSELLHNLNQLQYIGRVNSEEYGLLKANITRGEFEVVKKFIKQRSPPEEKRVSNNTDEKDDKDEAEGPNTPVANESDGGESDKRWNEYAKSYKARAEKKRRAAAEAADAAEEERRAAEEERRALHQQWRESLAKREQERRAAAEAAEEAEEGESLATGKAEKELLREGNLAREMETIADEKQGGRQGSGNQRFGKLARGLGSLINRGDKKKFDYGDCIAAAESLPEGNVDRAMMRCGVGGEDFLRKSTPVN